MHGLRFILPALDWVTQQSIDRKRRELEAEDAEYAERLAKARQREELLRRAARARVRKRMVRALAAILWQLF